ncbi:hypothetical protein pEaSNUABM11_00281 [Erwinia phage pEa_SNUABM_11]|nr:hypothetical protein pEaSNUABM11_00281 [Erwinia phage pEa_SNUABM_11]
MTTKIHSLKDLIAALAPEDKAIVEISKDNGLTTEVKDAVNAVYADTLPTVTIEVPEDHKGKLAYQVTPENMDQFRKHDANFLEAYGTVLTPLVGEHVRANADVAQMDLTTEVGNSKFSVVFARPTGETPSEKEWASSVGFGYATPKAKSLEGKVRKDFGKSFFETEDEE